MTEGYPDAVRLRDIKDRKGHLCQGGHFDLRLGPVCGCGVVLDSVQDFMASVPRGTVCGCGAAHAVANCSHVPRGTVDFPNEEPPLVSSEDNPPAPFRHAGGEPCYGCQSCLTEASDIDDGHSDSTPSDLMAEADAVEAVGREVVAQHDEPDMSPSVPVIDPTMPYGPAEVERAILDSNRRLELGLKHEAHLIAATEQLKIEYDLAFARSVAASRAGAADQRKADAILATERELRAWAEAKAARDAMKSVTHTLRSTLSALQSVGRSVGLSYSAPQGRGR